MCMPDNLQLPAAALGDRIHALLKGVLSSIPIAGGVAAEFFNLVVVPPLTKKTERWMILVTEGLCRLTESNFSFDLNKLAESEDFAAAVLDATQAAMKTSDEKKLLALKNAVLNTALAPAMESHLRESAMFGINRLTSAHLAILMAIVDYGNRGRLPPAADCPVLSQNLNFTNSLVHDLIEADIVSIAPAFRYDRTKHPFWINTEGALGDQWLGITPLGKTILALISEPK